MSDVESERQAMKADHPYLYDWISTVEVGTALDSLVLRLFAIGDDRAAHVLAGHAASLRRGWKCGRVVP